MLCCNVRNCGTGIRFARPYSIFERNGIRLGVIGVMGTNAARFTIMPSKITELEFTDPVEETRKFVAALKDSVDLIVVLGHMGLLGPMQTDAENESSIQRPLDEDLRFCEAVLKATSPSPIPVASMPTSYRAVSTALVSWARSPFSTPRSPSP